LPGRLIGVDLFPFEGDLRRVVAIKTLSRASMKDPDRALLAALLSVIPEKRAATGSLLVTPDAIPRAGNRDNRPDAGPA